VLCGENTHKTYRLGEVDIPALEERHGIDFARYFAAELDRVEAIIRSMTPEERKRYAEKLGRVGKVLPGYRADLAFWKLKDRGFFPYNEKKPISLIGNMITHSGRTVRDLMVRGEFIISNRLHNLINESQLLVELQTAHTALRKRLGD